MVVMIVPMVAVIVRGVVMIVWRMVAADALIVMVAVSGASMCMYSVGKVKRSRFCCTLSKMATYKNIGFGGVDTAAVDFGNPHFG